MLGLQRWARLTGHKNPNIGVSPPGEELPVLTAAESRLDVPRWHSQGGSMTFTAFSARVDPPVGGFASLATIFQLGRDDGDLGVIGAVGTAPDATWWFSAGVYRYQFEICGVSQATSGAKHVYIFQPRDTNTFPWTNRELLIPQATFASPSARGKLTGQIMFPVPFVCWARAGILGLADTDVYQINGTLENVFLLDEQGSASSLP